MTKARIIILASMFLSSFACADQVITFIKGSPPDKHAEKSYLKKGFIDEGYVSISVQLNNAGSQSCIAPAINTFFREKKLDAILTAQIFGFFGVDSKEIPIATYSWTGSNYCRSAWRAPLLLVPPTPIASHEARGFSTIAEDPKIILRLRSSSADEAHMSAHAQALLGVTSAMATGGAANTVAGLSKLAGGPAVAYLSDQFNQQFKNDADQTWEIRLSWDALAKGNQLEPVRMVSRELKWNGMSKEKPVDIIKKLQKSEIEGNDLLTLDFRTNLSRTIFASDDMLSSGLPKKEVLYRKNILNYPRNNLLNESDVPTLYQRINFRSPSPLNNGAEKKADECAMLITSVRDLGFNSIDRAIIVGAFLDERYPEWRRDQKFRMICSSSEPNIETVLVSIDPDYFPDPPLPSIPTLAEPETAINFPAGSSLQAQFMRNVHLTLLSNFNIQAKGLQELLGDAPWQVSSSILKPNENEDVKTQRDTIFKNLDPRQVGCIFAYYNDGSPDLNTALLFSGKDSTGKSGPYVLAVQQELSAGSVRPKHVWVASLDEPFGKKFMPALEAAQFSEASICYRGKNMISPEKSVANLLKEFRDKPSPAIPQ